MNLMAQQELDQIKDVLAAYRGVLTGATADQVRKIVAIASSLGQQRDQALDRESKLTAELTALRGVESGARAALRETLGLVEEASWDDIQGAAKELCTFLKQDMKRNETLADQKERLLERRNRLQKRVDALEQTWRLRVVPPRRTVRVPVLCEDPSNCSIDRHDHFIAGGNLLHYESLSL